MQETGALTQPWQRVETHVVSVDIVRQASFRLDASHYREIFTSAAERIASTSMPKRKVSEMAGAFVPQRMKLVTVPNRSAGAPYLRAHDAFEIRASSNRYVAKGRTKNYENLLLKKGMLLTPSSGRNLGPMAYVGEYLSQFAMTDIMRIIPFEEDFGWYLFAYLRTETGQALIRKGRSGTTVDHLSPEEVLGIDVPWIEDTKLRDGIISEIRDGQTMIDDGRLGLDKLGETLHSALGLSHEPTSTDYLTRKCGDVFSVPSVALQSRLDAAYYDPTAQLAARELLRKGGARLGELATPLMLGRYKRYYVDPPHGRPILSGRQILQTYPVNLKHISDRSFTDPEQFVLRQGMTIFTCDGRSEEALGEPGYVMPIWDGWMASNHVMRLLSKPGVSSGYLYLCICSPWVQAQLKACASGSVIDAIEPDSASRIVLPLLDVPLMTSLGAEVEKCWNLISSGLSKTDSSVARFQSALDG